MSRARGRGAVDPVEAIARAVLYEGYLLWPYRRSARKNQTRFTFGALYPRGFCEAARERDAWRLRCECLVEGPRGARVGVELRFLQLVHRQALVIENGVRRAVDEIEVAGERRLTWDEARERRHALPASAVGALAERPVQSELEVEAGREDETLGRLAGVAGATGVLERSREPLDATIEVGAAAAGDRLWRIAVEVTNRSGWTGVARLEAQRRALLSAHLVLRVDALADSAPAEGAAGFVSLADPPPAWRAAARACRNEGVWPVLAGEPGARDTVLASPIVLEDHPRTAPESAGDLFDGAEIVELLDLSILALTDREKREMAATDPAARAILERTEALDRESRARLHGTLRPRHEGR